MSSVHGLLPPFGAGSRCPAVHDKKSVHYRNDYLEDTLADERTTHHSVVGVHAAACDDDDDDAH